MFIVILKYEKSIETVMKYLEEHNAFLDKYYTANKNKNCLFKRGVWEYIIWADRAT